MFGRSIYCRTTLKNILFEENRQAKRYENTGIGVLRG
jgi:hypothetical protein